MDIVSRLLGSIEILYWLSLADALFCKITLLLCRGSYSVVELTGPWGNTIF